MALPKEPRQLMINLMYLVLTALLAMNVSSDILNAFKNIGKSISNSNRIADERNKGVTEMFSKYQENPKVQEDKRQKVKEAMELVKQVNDKTDAMVAELENYKKMVIVGSGGYDEKGQIKRIDDVDGGTRVMIKQGNGSKLLSALQNYKNEVAGLVPLDGTKMVAPGTNQEIFNQLPLTFDVEKTDMNPSGDWSYANFYMSPTIANVTLLDKYINDVRACQSVALDNIWSLATGEVKNRPQVITPPKTFNDYAIIVSADNTYVLPGEKYRARIMMGTYNRNLKNLSFNVNGRTISPVNGVAEYTEIAGNTVGAKNITVSATFTDSVVDAEGRKSVQTRTVRMDKPAQYFIGESNATISLDKMNVMYIGLENPITIAASGIPAGNISYSTEGCTLTPAGGSGKFFSKVTQSGGRAKITLTGKLADGTTKNFGTYEYRIQRVPDPYPVVAQSRGGAGVPVNAMKIQQAVFAKLDNFPYELKFPVISFTMAYQPKRGEYEEVQATGELLKDNPNPRVGQILDKLKVGDRLYFENIRVKAPEGTRNIGSINFVFNQ